jgi:formimidoylglutamate deiminase
LSGRGQLLAAELTWTGERFERGVVVEIGGDGRITTTYPARPPEEPRGTAAAPPAGGHPAESGTKTAASPPLPVRHLAGRALLPGFVNAHSHAFQRGLRGRGERFPGGAGSFWSWREAMYGLVGEVDRDRLLALSRAAFAEMRAAGITAVGEFHYLHHDDPEARDFAFDKVVLAAAAEAGIRIALLETFYAAGGIGRPLGDGQRRFATPSVEGYWEQVDRLAEGLDPGLQSLGAVGHSIRAAGIDQLATLWTEARRRGLPFHMHLEEQRREIEETEAATGRRPMELVLDELDVGPGFTAVHCTHTRPDELARFTAAGGTLCVCPLTEANLGDGLPALAAALTAREARAAEPGGGLLGRLCLGTDANARNSMLEVRRWLEYGQRLAGERRGALRDPASGRVAPALLAAATAGGARALGLEAGEIAPGRWADLVAIDLGHPQLAAAPAGGGSDPADTLAEALIFGAGDGVVAATCVGGRWDRTPW